jgi:hypothetical protein
VKPVLTLVVIDFIAHISVFSAEAPHPIALPALNIMAVAYKLPYREQLAKGAKNPRHSFYFALERKEISGITLRDHPTSQNGV